MATEAAAAAATTLLQVCDEMGDDALVWELGKDITYGLYTVEYGKCFWGDHK